MFSLSPTGQLLSQAINQPDYKFVSEYVNDRSYLEVCDFDDHFENVSNDWTNAGLIKGE